MAGISLAGTGLYASFGTGGFLCHLPVVPVVVQRRLFIGGIAVAAVCTGVLGVALFRAGRLHHFLTVHMIGSRNGFRIGMAGISLAGTGLYARLGAGGFLCHLPVVPVVVKRRNFFLLNQRGTADFTFLALGQAGLRTGRLLAGNNNGGMFRLVDGHRVIVGRVAAAFVVVVTCFGAGGILVILQLVIMVKRRSFFLLNQRGTADFTFLALGQAGLRTGRLLAGNSDGVMSRLGDGFRPCCFAPCAGVSLDASISTGGFCGHFAFVPFMVGLWDGFALFEELVAVLTIKVAGIALFGAGGFLLVCGNHVDVVVGVFFTPPLDPFLAALTAIPICPDALVYPLFRAYAGGVRLFCPAVHKIVVSLVLETAPWCAIRILNWRHWRRPITATAGVAFLFRHRGVCRKATDRNAGTQTQQQAQTCRKFPSSASHRVKPPLSP